MAKYSPANLMPDVAERARRLARHRNLSLGAYIAELVDADHKATFGEEPSPIIYVATDASGAPVSFTVMTEPHVEVPASLAAGFAEHVERVATIGGARAELSEAGDFMTIERSGPAIIVTAGDKRWSLGVHRARQIAREISDKAAMHLPRKVA